MLLPTNDGIRCDRCGGTEQHDFTYYSVDFREMAVRQTILPRPNLKQPATFSLDICTKCFDEIGELVKKAYKPNRMTADRRCQGGVICDITGTKIVTGRIYYCNIIKIDVHTSGMATVCDKCSRRVEDTKEPCPHCGNTTFSKSASTNINEQWLELLLDEPTFEQLKKRAIKLRTSEAAQWSASSD